MTSQEFVDALKKVVVSNTVSGIDKVLQKPPGRSPDKSTVDMSNWYNQLKEADRDMLITIIKEAVESTTFSFLCVLDGVSAIEGYGEKGTLELYYKKDGKEVLLTDPDKDYLHDLLKG